MQRPLEPGNDTEQLYEVVLASRPPDSLRRRFPTMSIQVTGVQTALRRRASSGQLDALLENLSSLGVRLLDVHRLPGPVAHEEHTYEVRVEGEVGEPLLSYLDWPHQVVRGQSRVRIAGAAHDLHRFLQGCTESGAGIQRVRLLDPARQHQPAYP